MAKPPEWEDFERDKSIMYLLEIDLSMISGLSVSIIRAAINYNSSVRLMINITNLLIAVSVLSLALVIDLLLRDPDPRSPWRLQYKLHPTVLMGKLTKLLESLSRTRIQR